MTRRILLPLLLSVWLAAPTGARADELPRLDPHAGQPLPGERVAFVVHGINPTPGQLDPLAADLAARGYRVFQFHYDDDHHLDRSAARLGEAVRAVLDRQPAARVAIVAHSMGGLVARRALTRGHAAGLAGRPERILLVTAASPFGGFVAANFSVLDFDLGPDSHNDLGSWSSFIKRPGALGDNVRHVKVETDERRQTRRAGGREVPDQSVLPDQQRNRRVDEAAAERHVLTLGHVEVVNDDERVSSGFSALLDRLLGPVRPRPADRGPGADLARATGAAGCPRPVALAGARGHEVELEGARVARLSFDDPADALRWATWTLDRRRGEDATVVEVRGREVLIATGPALVDADRAASLRRAAWHDGPEVAPELLARYDRDGAAARLRGAAVEHGWLNDLYAQARSHAVRAADDPWRMHWTGRDSFWLEHGETRDVVHVTRRDDGSREMLLGDGDRAGRALADGRRHLAALERAPTPVSRTRGLAEALGDPRGGAR